MTRWRGFSQQLQTPHDLLRKMSRDLDRMRLSPGDSFAAFDFFVAAEAIVDWLWPGDRKRREAARRLEPARTVSHLASGAKHFEATEPRHASVLDVSAVPGRGTSVLGRAILGQMQLGSKGHPSLVIRMADGQTIEAISLAASVLAYWEAELREQRTRELEQPPPGQT